jgi:hypothetical protein
VLDEAQSLGFTCKHEGETSNEPPPASRTDETILAFFRLLPPAALKAAYYKAAGELHPDHGGDLEAMKKLNQLWHQIEK